MGKTAAESGAYGEPAGSQTPRPIEMNFEAAVGIVVLVGIATAVYAIYEARPFRSPDGRALDRAFGSALRSDAIAVMGTGEDGLPLPLVENGRGLRTFPNESSLERWLCRAAPARTSVVLIGEPPRDYNQQELIALPTAPFPLSCASPAKFYALGPKKPR